MYIMLPDVASARGLANDLLLARVEDRHMRFLARRGTDLGELPEASYFHKTDAIHGAFVGLVIGGILGAVVGGFLVNYPPPGASLEMVAVLVAALVGAMLGVWVATMVGLQVPNSRLRHFARELDDGKVLLMLDVPSRRFDEVREIIARKHPESVDRGHEPTVPAFP
jgi:uncharacterized membrane protein YeaQ/YmgE (transglycosylase-associated protein family)